ncbi:MAG: hypothetical protein PGN07_03825 [Aeromicrobium erythreum]
MGGTTSRGTAGEPWFAEVRRRHPDVDVVLLEPEPRDAAPDPGPATADPRHVEQECARLSARCAEVAALPGTTPTAPRWVPGTAVGRAQHVVAHHAHVDESASRSALASLATSLADLDATPLPVPDGALALAATVPTSVGPVQVRALFAAELGRWSVTVTSPEVAVDPTELATLLDGGVA